MGVCVCDGCVYVIVVCSRVVYGVGWGRAAVSMPVPAWKPRCVTGGFVNSTRTQAEALCYKYVLATALRQSDSTELGWRDGDSLRCSSPARLGARPSKYRASVSQSSQPKAHTSHHSHILQTALIHTVMHLPEYEVNNLATHNTTTVAVVFNEYRLHEMHPIYLKSFSRH